MLRVQRAESICIIVNIHLNSLPYYEFANIKAVMPIAVSTVTYEKIYTTLNHKKHIAKK